MKNYRLIGAIAISVSAILWGIDGVVLTPRLFNLDVSFVVFMLHLIPFTILNIFLWKEYKHIKEMSKKDMIAFSLIAIFGGALGTLSIVKALFLMHFQHLTVVALLQKLQPIFAILLARILLKEKFTKHYLALSIFAIVGSYFLTFGMKLPSFATGDNTFQAAMYALVAAFSFGSSTVFGKFVTNKYSFTTSTFFRYGLTTLVMIIVILLTGKSFQFSQITNQNWLFFGIIGLTSGTGAIMLYYFGLKHVKAMTSAICELFFPVSAILFDYLINKSVLSIPQWIGAIVLIGAITSLIISQKRFNKEHYARRNEIL
ncbi:MAG: DMT family transporter [Candidatus Cloacimonadota bacterium]|nr:DMT family transporter [Candidatus Cloacimonadota bacterium]